MSDNSQTRYIPLPKWNDYHIWPPIGGLRHLVANAKAKKFDGVFIKVSGRILLDEKKFFEWAREYHVRSGQ